VVKLVGHKEPVLGGSFSLDGQQVVTASNDGTARVWDVKSGKEIARLQGHDKGVTSAAFSPDGQRVVTGSKDGTARIWDTTPKFPLLAFATLGYHRDVSTATFSAHGRLVVTTSWEDNTARVWDVETGKQVAQFSKKDEDKIRDAAFGSEGRRRVVTSGTNIARVWDLESGKEIAHLQHEGNVDTAAFSPDGRLIVTTSSYRFQS
jgi:WD40 repeat protein